ncbi:Thiol:disulfide interchange protein TlpA [termite gut metagenome]|uniref:Thiol:disulfide interchange protein TlpA n=1 Tax=termite gut metagenome TaxID=433724 RepID=A0A5J4SHR6_9ZZZZ
MKQTFLFLTLATMLLSGCSKQEAILTGKISGTAGSKTLVYTAPISETCYLGFTDTLQVDDTGSFEVKFAITKPVFITLWTIEPYKQAKLLIEPGKSYDLVFEDEKDVQISGQNEKGQMFLSTLPNPSYVEMEGRSFIRDTSLLSIHENIEKLKQDDLNHLKELLERKEISPVFFKRTEADRNCYYASLETRILLIKTYPLIQKRSDEDLLKAGGNLFKKLEEIYSQYPPNDENLIISSFWSEYAEGYVTGYKQFSQPDFDMAKFSQMRQDETIHAYMMHESTKYLTGKVLEFFQARYIHFIAYAHDDYEKELITVFDRFQKDYPQSQYANYVAPLIEKIVAYHQIIEQPFSEEMKFMAHYEDINTLEEAVKQLKGKAIYIDVWATWCSPCKHEFQHNAALKKILAENDIQQLYISIDDDKREKRWENGIKYFHLTGTHIRANKSLWNDLAKRFDKKNGAMLSIPWYILVDKNGNVLDEHAKSPSQLVTGEEFASKNKL